MNNVRFHSGFFESVYFMKHGYTMNEDGSYVTHVINKGVVGTYYSDLERELYEIASNLTQKDEMFVPRRMRQIFPDGVQPLKYFTCGIQYINKVPLKIQIEACALVAGISTKEMYGRMKHVSK